MVRLKERRDYDALKELFAFQFLMVRLKVNISDILPMLKHISIPYGAIKSPLICEYVQNLRAFQFLMVRLKVQLQLLYPQPSQTFQFLMVRLKVLKKVDSMGLSL